MITMPRSYGHAARSLVLGGVHAMCTASRRVERQCRSEAVFDGPGTVPGVRPGSSVGGVLTWMCGSGRVDPASLNAQAGTGRREERHHAAAHVGTLWSRGAVGAGRATAASAPQWTVPLRTTFWRAAGLKGHTPARATGG